MRWDGTGYHLRRTVFLVATRLDPLSIGATLDRDGSFEVESAGEKGVLARFAR